MTVTEWIKKLKEVKAEHGDVRVMLFEDTGSTFAFDSGVGLDVLGIAPEQGEGEEIVAAIMSSDDLAGFEELDRQPNLRIVSGSNENAPLTHSEGEGATSGWVEGVKSCVDLLTKLRRRD